MCVYEWQTMLNYDVGAIMYNMRFASATGRRHVCPNVHFQIWGGRVWVYDRRRRYLYRLTVPKPWGPFPIHCTLSSNNSCFQMFITWP